MIVAFTGHRPDKLGGYFSTAIQDRIATWIECELLVLEPEKAISGMALGVDQWAAQICIDLDIPFTAAVPFEGQEKKWPLEAQIVYKRLLNQAAEVVNVCGPGYSAWKMQKRNQWMVDHCDLLIAVYDGSPGGTRNCFNYAKMLGKKIVHIHPLIGKQL